jgi:hypothetical protein
MLQVYANSKFLTDTGPLCSGAYGANGGGTAPIPNTPNFGNCMLQHIPNAGVIFTVSDMTT